MLPYQRFTITTLFSPEDVCKKLTEIVEPPQPLRLGRKKSEKLYQGQIGEHSFQISRIIHYRNSFLPIIEGRIQPQRRGSQIEIQMKLNPVVLIFMLAWLAIVGQAALLFLVVLFQEEFDPMFLIPVGMFVYGLILPLIGFFPEAQKSKKFLIEFFQGF